MEGLTGTIARVRQNEASDAIAAIRRDGVAIIDQAWPEDRIAEIADALAARHPESLEGGQAFPADSFEVGGGRFTAPLIFTPPFDCTDILLHPALVEVFSALLGPDFVFEAFGVICARPGAEEQHIHRDGGLVFEGTGIEVVLPPVALTFAIPLVTQDAETGMTAFWPGSHRQIEKPGEEGGISACLPRGSCALWDFRVRHRGLANRTDHTRPLLYATACRPFWIDHKNFVAGRNAKLIASRAALETMEKADRKRFVRAELVT